jgi:hypothetical protein
VIAVAEIILRAAGCIVVIAGEMWLFREIGRM